MVLTCFFVKMEPCIQICLGKSYAIFDFACMLVYNELDMTEVCVRVYIVIHVDLLFNIWQNNVCALKKKTSSSSQRPMTSDFERFSIPDFIHYIFFLS